MQRKKVDFSVLSEKRCIVCGKPLKKNVTDRNPDADMCYKHYQIIIRKNPLVYIDIPSAVYMKISKEKRIEINQQVSEFRKRKNERNR